MWIIVRYKPNELDFLKKKFKEILLNEPEYFIPKIRYNKLIRKKFKTFKKSILEGYLICFHTKFSNQNIMNNLKYVRGLNYILDGFKNHQEEIKNFIKRCKNFEDKDGFLSQDFFSFENLTKGRFISGPFTNLVFEVLSKQADKIEILIGKYKTIIPKKTNFLYKPI